MKKTALFGLAVMATATLLAVESKNIVGYNTYSTGAVAKPSFGACFLPINGATTYKLGTLKPANFDVDNDILTIVDSDTLGTAAQYVYMSKEMADAAAEADELEPGAYDELIGWWNPDIGVGEEEAVADNVNISVGQGFLGLFDSGENIGVVSSGDVPLTTTAISTDAAPKPFFASYIPQTITLGQIVPEGFDVDNDLLTVVDSTTLGTAAQYVYMSKDMADAAAEADELEPGAYDELIGWWNPDIGVGEEEAAANNVQVAPGAAFLGLFDSGNDITFNFPAVNQ